jgi:hypothetical protein
MSELKPAGKLVPQLYKLAVNKEDSSIQTKNIEEEQAYTDVSPQ